MADTHVSERDVFNALLRALEDERRTREGGGLAVDQKKMIGGLLGSLASLGYCKLAVVTA